MPISNWALEKFVAPDAASLIRNNMLPLPEAASSRRDWVGNFLLNAMFVVSMPDTARALRMAAILRVQGCCFEYEEMSLCLTKYIESRRGQIDCLFAALRHAEQWAHQAYQGYMLIKTIAGQERLFDKGDGSVLQRLNEIQNASKHAYEKLSSGNGEKVLAVWLSDSGIHCSAAALTHEEMAHVVDDLSIAALALSSPKAK